MERLRNNLNKSLNERRISRAEDIRNALNIKWKDLEGKKIVDVGAGMGEFVAEAQSRGIDVFSFDINDFSNNNATQSNYDAISEHEREEYYPNDHVIGDHTELPFPDETFDLVVSSFAGPMVAKGADDKVNVVKEILRVVKTSGEVRVGSYPIEKDYKKFPNGRLFNPSFTADVLNSIDGSSVEKVDRGNGTEVVYVFRK